MVKAKEYKSKIIQDMLNECTKEEKILTEKEMMVHLIKDRMKLFTKKINSLHKELLKFNAELNKNKNLLQNKQAINKLDKLIHNLEVVGDDLISAGGAILLIVDVIENLYKNNSSGLDSESP